MNTLTRWARHLWLDANDTRRLLTDAGLQRLEAAVVASEARHLGELRVCIEAGLPIADLRHGTTPRQRATALFSHLRVWDTAHNNGVLIYLLLADRRLEILADRGLHERAHPDAWQALSQRLSAALREGQYEAGLAQAIAEVGELLRTHFPLQGQANPNELPNAIVLI
jgi:uncharacterized membrane protein